MKDNIQTGCIRPKDIEKATEYVWKCQNCEKIYKITTLYADQSPKITRCRKTKRPCIIRKIS